MKLKTGGNQLASGRINLKLGNYCLVQFAVQVSLLPPIFVVYFKESDEPELLSVPEPAAKPMVPNC